MIDAAASDAILALVALVAGLRLLQRGGGAGTAGVGLILVGIAATFGTIRFGGVQSLAQAHDGVSRLASLVGIPLVGSGYLSVAFFPQHAVAVRPYVFVSLLVAAVALIGVPLYGTVIGGAAMIGAAVAAIVGLRRPPSAAAEGLAGAVGVLLCGLVVSGEGSWGPLSRTAWLHLGLSASCALLATGLLRGAPSEG
ncbi:MAG TPA: hypothetical protein ENK18_12290 [Deltaproteobacteria bacterium]|nr:hypothetical protein [Deltaproteobacteria bacterium]